MAVAAKDAKPVSLAQEEKARSLWSDAWMLFRRNRMAVVSLFIIIGLFVLAITADLWRRLGLIDDPYRQHRGSVLARPLECAKDNTLGQPQYCFIVGADGLGRDIFTRVAYGTQISLTVGIVGTVISLFVGTIYGLISGYYGGRIDNVMMRVVDYLSGLPGIVIIILMQVFFDTIADYAQDPAYRQAIGPLGTALVDLDRRMGGMFFVFIAIGLLGWIGEARLTRGQVLSLKQKEFIEAARSVGARDRRIIFVHLLPNIVGPLVVVGALSVPGYIFTEATLSALGLGINPPTPSWGSMIGEAYQVGFQFRPYLIFGPGAMLALTVLAFIFFGDGLRDAFDPQQRGR